MSLFPIHTQQPQPWKALSKEEILRSHQTIERIRFKGGALLFASIFIFMIAAAFLILGALFLGTPQDFCNVVQEVVVTMILPSLFAIFFISAPAFMFGLTYDHISRSEHKKIAESQCAKLRQFYDERPLTTVSKKDVVTFIEEQLLLKEFSRLFSSISLSQTIQVARKAEGFRDKQRETIVDALETAKSRLFMNARQKKKQEEEMKAET